MFWSTFLLFVPVEGSVLKIRTERDNKLHLFYLHQIKKLIYHDRY
jgi:hypothetical protein